MRCPSCNEANPADAAFCGSCGAALETERVCPDCGRSNRPEIRFCHGCGRQLAETSAPESLAAPQPTIPDTFVSGRYQVRRFLGEGAKKRVYLARDTRLDRDVAIGVIKSEGLDAVVLACAGLDRLDLGHRIDERISPELMLPAIGQGLLALETRSGDPLAERLRALEEPEVGAVARAERAYQARLGGDCSVPLAGFAERVGEGELRFRGLVASLDGKEIAEAERSATMSDASALGAGVAEAVLAAGGREILEALAAEAGETPDG